MQQDELALGNTVRADAGDPPSTAKPYRIWALHCPFNKRGFPVLGNFGYTERGVIIVPVETWNRLCEENPGLKTTQFEVGSYE